MPLTRFPNGVTVNSTTALVYNTAAGDGAVDCNNLYVFGTTSANLITVTSLTATTLLATNINVPSTGRLSLGVSTVTSGVTMIGERLYVPISFTSAAATTYLAVPFAGNLVDCWITADTTPRTCSAFTLYANGTAGTVCVASVALAYATAIGQQIQPTLTSAIQGVGTALAFVVTTAGSAVNFSGMVVIQRSA